MATLEKVFAQIADFSRTMGILNGDYLKQLRTGIDDFLKKTEDLSAQMNWQGWTTVGLTTFSATFAIAGAMLPQATGTAPQLSPFDPNAPFQSGLRIIGQKLQDHDFLRATCKTAAKTFHGVTPAADTWGRAKTAKTEADRTLLERVTLQNSKQGQDTCTSQMQQAQNLAQSILQSKAKGG